MSEIRATAGVPTSQKQDFELGRGGLVKGKIFRYYLPVFRIHDILGWIRIRGSMPLTNGSGSGSWTRVLLFSSLTFKMQAKN
jgi:hypothetical protein